MLASLFNKIKPSQVIFRQGYNFAVYPELYKKLKEFDPEVNDILKQEYERHLNGLNLLAHQNYSSKAVHEMVGSVMNAKYSEGYIGHRYYGGSQEVDKSEGLTIKRALNLFKLDDNKWSVNVQSLSVNMANFAIMNAFLKPHQRILSLQLSHGGHLSFGFHQLRNKISQASKYFETMYYETEAESGQIDYDKLSKLSKKFRPKLIIAGGQNYTQLVDWKKMKDIATAINAYLLADITQISHLVCAGLVDSPFNHADFVTLDPAPGLRGPNGGLVYCRSGYKGQDAKGQMEEYNYKDLIDQALFPGLQGGPHNHTIAAIGISLKEAAEPDFAEYAKQTQMNAETLCKFLLENKLHLAFSGSKTSMLTIDMKKSQMNAVAAETLLDQLSIFANRQLVPGDISLDKANGLQLGTQAMTTRGMKEAEFKQVGEFLVRGLQILPEVMKGYTQEQKVQQYVKEQAKANQQVESLKKEVQEFSSKFPVPGISGSDF